MRDIRKGRDSIGKGYVGVRLSDLQQRERRRYRSITVFQMASSSVIEQARQLATECAERVEGAFTSIMPKTIGAPAEG
jgi:hypothetical protein